MMMSWKLFCTRRCLRMLGRNWVEKGGILWQRFGEADDVVLVEIGRRLIQCQYSAVETKGLGQGKTNDEGGENLRLLSGPRDMPHLLARTAPPAHINLHVALHHHHAIIERTISLCILSIGSNLNGVDVWIASQWVQYEGTWSLVGAGPQFAYYFVDFLHLHRMIFHDCTSHTQIH